MMTTSKTPSQTHDVFLSFKGEDTRYTFIGHLHAALTRLQVKTYINDNGLEGGSEIPHSLLKAISDAKVSVIVFSQNYASSSRCLDEVVKILECNKNNGQLVVPVFYHIGATHVRNQTGSYAVAFEEYEKRYASDLKKVQTWRMALAEASNFSGWDCPITRMESELVEQIGMEILQKLDGITMVRLERRIVTYKQIATQKLNKSLKTGKLSDIEDLVTTLQQLADMKLEKALRTEDLTVWADLMATYQRIVKQKMDIMKRNYNPQTLEDLQATTERITYLESELSHRQQGLGGI